MRTFIFILALFSGAVGCNSPFEVTEGDTCEVATNDGKAVRCFNPHGICYLGLPDGPECRCNGESGEGSNTPEGRLLCAEAQGYQDAR